MKNLKLRKILLTICSAMLLVTLSVGATFAYLTSTATVTNTFTVGKVAITLDEAKVDVYGKAVTPEQRITSNEYKLMPGHSYTKDPTVHFAAGSEASWLFVKVENGITNIEAATNTIAAQIETNGWKALDGNVYYKSVEANTTENDVDYKVFESFTIKDEVESKDLNVYEGAKVTVTAYAVQADGFGTAAAAWEATFGSPTTGE